MYINFNAKGKAELNIYKKNHSEGVAAHIFITQIQHNLKSVN